MNFQKSLKRELKHNYLYPLIWSIIGGSVFFFCSAGYFATFLFGIGLFTLAVTISAYLKSTYKKVDDLR